MENKLEPTKSSGLVFGGITFETFDALEAFGEKMVKTGLTPLKSGKAAAAAALMGKELGLDLMVSLNNIIPINGKATLGIHLITALLQKAGVVIELVRDYEPCVPFVMKGEDDKPLLDKEGKPTILRTSFYDEPPKEMEIRAKNVVDYRTVVKMTRTLLQPNKTSTVSTIIRSFSRNDAIKAGLLDTSKPDSAWGKYTAQQCYNRAIAFAGRAIASDILLGIYETSEMADVTGITYTVEDGKVIIPPSNENQDKQSNKQDPFEDAKEVEQNSEENNETTS